MWLDSRYHNHHLVTRCSPLLPSHLGTAAHAAAVHDRLVYGRPRRGLHEPRRWSALRREVPVHFQVCLPPLWINRYTDQCQVNGRSAWGRNSPLALAHELTTLESSLDDSEDDTSVRIGDRPASRHRRGTRSVSPFRFLLMECISLPNSASASALSFPPTRICEGVQMNLSRAPASCRN